MSNHSRISKRMFARICHPVSEHYYRGMDVKDIADAVGVGYDTVKKAIRVMGLSREQRGRRPSKHIGPQTFSEICYRASELFHRGWHIQDIAKDVGVHKHTLYRALAIMGLDTSQRIEVRRRKAFEMRQRGWHRVKIGMHLGVTPNYTDRLAREHKKELG